MLLSLLGAALLSTPAHAACSVTLLKPNLGATVHNSPTFTWKSTGDCVSYKVELFTGLSPGPMTSTSSGWLGAVTEWTLDEATWEAKIATVWPEHVRWRVKSVDSLGHVTSTSTRSVNVDADGDTWSAAFGDCDDTDASINPDAPEVCADGIDNDCEPPGFRGVHVGTNNGALFYAGYDIAADPAAIDEYLDWIDSIHANWVGIYVAMQYTDAVDTSLTMTRPADAYTGSPDEGYGTWTWDDDVLTAMTTALKGHTNADGEPIQVYWALALEPLDDNGTPTNPVDDDEMEQDRDLFGYTWAERPDAMTRGYVESEWIWDDPESVEVQAFWASYTSNAVAFATLADTLGVDMVSLGVETDGLFRTRYAEYLTGSSTALFESVDSVYDGLITYDMHWNVYDEGDDVQFEANMDLWDTVPFDVIGVSAWVPLQPATYTVPLGTAAYASDWDAVLSDRLTEVHARFPDTPVVFTEFGYADYVDAGYSVDEHVNASRVDPTATDGETTQSEIYQAFYDVREADYCDIVEGTFIWADGPLLDADWNDLAADYHTTGVRSWTYGSVTHSLSNDVIAASYGAWED